MADSEADPWTPPAGVRPFVTTTKVRFADIDGMRHVNNAKYVTYLENARTEWVHAIDDPKTFDDIEFILARVEIDFKAAATLDDVVEITMWVPRIGKRSWDFAYRLTNAADGMMYAVARTTQVAFDYEAGMTQPVPERYLSHIEALCGDTDRA